jgi:hypothetical protein
MKTYKTYRYKFNHRGVIIRVIGNIEDLVVYEIHENYHGKEDKIFNALPLDQFNQLIRLEYEEVQQ